MYTKEQLLSFAEFVSAYKHEPYSDGQWYYHLDGDLFTLDQLLEEWEKEAN